MAFSNQLFFLFLLLLSVASNTHGADLISKKCGSTPAANNSALQANINSIILDLVTKTTANGFANSTYGYKNDAVYGTAECRGDVNGQVCSACIVAAGQEIQTSCANTTESRIWYHQCSLRYSTTNFMGQPDTALLSMLRSTSAPKDPQAFNKTLKEMFSVLTVAAASSGERRKFAWGKIERHGKVTNEGAIITVYGMAHCTWDLEESPCSACLGAALSNVNEEWDGYYIMLKSCAVRYEVYPFLFLNAAPNPAIDTGNVTFSNI
ncbi:cysteine-rich repeat secretory protein 38-like [Phalaenopsis equestris]|uniref:cysteine-rich repeat secretory protein 38-like n=1 Tax=Phalaenopsis equestris TaxID=78828 RepID=UPI0009E31DCD|nr:cysteine-rich repeat secretory protein 38-like [Phalaenopsis equestris]